MASEENIVARSRKVRNAAVLSVGANILLVLIKYGLATLSGSLALVADAWHSLSDIIVSILVLVGVWIGKKQSRLAAVLENLIALAISALIFAAAYVLVAKSFQPPAEEGLRHVPIALVGAVVCAAISWLIGQYKSMVGAREDSLSLRADGSHSIMDFYTTVVVIVGLLGQMIGLRLDGIAALLVVLFVAEVGLEIAVAAIRGVIRREGFSRSAFNPLNHQWVAGASRWIHRGAARCGWIDERPLRVILGQWLKIHRKPLTRLAWLLLLLTYGLSGLFFVAPQQTALVTIFGRALPRPAAPGIHYAPPWPVGRVYKVDTSLIRRIELGFRSRPLLGGEVRANRSSYEWQSYHKAGNYEKKIAEAIMLTGDENLLDLNVVVHYDVANPFAFTFGFANLDTLLLATTETVLRSIVAVTPIDAILTGSRKELADRTFRSLQEMLDRFGSGARIIAVELQDVHPPVEVVDAFREVASAKEDMALIVNQAHAERNQNVPLARANASSSIVQAEAYRDSKAARATGEAAHFASLAAGAAAARDLTSFRLYADRMEKSLGGKRKFIISPTLAPGTLDLRIFANRQPTKPAGKQPKETPEGGMGE
ncbi:MAG: FtsH protease activity modulator HflK [Myxococcales bacterium]|nr:FtsH protease activity modulator HflK [Myxococcales bacterium]